MPIQTDFLDNQNSNLLADVAVYPLPGLLTYSLPEELKNLSLGAEITVPLGKREATGYIIAIYSKESAVKVPVKLKSVLPSSSGSICFSTKQLKLFKWVAQYYTVALSHVIDTALPATVPPKYLRFISPGPEEGCEIKGKLQKRVFDFVSRESSPVNYSLLLKNIPGAGNAVKKLAEKGILKVSSEEVYDSSASAPPDWAKEQVELTDEQKLALKEINSCVDSEKFSGFLLHGVTGSGKTEVYIEAVRQALENGKGALIIVPEIALTPQLIDRFTARLGTSISILHSAVNKRKRWDAWRALLDGKNRIAIGARSAVFAPVRDPGIIIVDEEHDSSFKQSDGLRYNARDLAVMLARQNSCPVVLGSATPSLESYYNAVQKKYRYLPLKARHGSATELDLEIVDLNSKKPWEMPSRNISPELHLALEQTMARGEQAFILYNRRGFASYLQCSRCEEVVECPNCSVTFTWHQSTNSLHCHYCNLKVTPPTFCAACQQDALEKEEEPGKLIRRGAGTEKIFEDLEKLFPDRTVDRLDRDVATTQEKYEDILNRARSGETDILVGTQMIAKGHDLPGVTLVGIADCDVGLHMPDFRAAERVFQLLTQAAGRAGRRDKPGRVLLQTRVPKHPALLKTAAQDYRGFARQELSARKALNYPPFSKLLRVIASSRVESLPEELLEKYREMLNRLIPKTRVPVQVLGPAPAPLARIKTEWRWHLILKSQSSSQLQFIISYLKEYKVDRNKIKVVFDLNPQDLL